MFDIQLRGVKDRLFNPLVPLVPSFVTPGHLTTVGQVFGTLTCVAATIPHHAHLAVYFWLANRCFDCLDGTLARHRHTASELGAFYDLLCDFVVYSAIPITIGIGVDADSKTWLAIAFVEATFHINNFVLFYFAAIQAKPREHELTSITMKPALIEGFESGVLFTAMLVFRSYIGSLCWIMGVGVIIGIVTRSWFLFDILSHVDSDRPKKLG